MPKFQHDCEKCTFHGTFFDHDVYTCENSINPEYGSIIARFGNDGPDYSSYPIRILKELMANNGNISGFDQGKEWNMPYQQWLFSNRSSPAISAMILGLAISSLEKLGTP